MLAPITVNTPNPTASHFRKIFQCRFNLGYKKKIEKPVMIDKIKYIGSDKAVGGYLPKITSRANPPASPVTLERITNSYDVSFLFYCFECSRNCKCNSTKIIKEKYDLWIVNKDIMQVNHT